VESAFTSMTVDAIGAPTAVIIGWVAGILVIPVAFYFGRKLIGVVLSKLRRA